MGTSAEKAAKAELFQKLEEDLEAMFEEQPKTNVKQAEDNGPSSHQLKQEDREKKGQTQEGKTEQKENVFKKVEDDLEAMFAGLDDNGDDIPETLPTPGALRRKSKTKIDSKK